MTRRPAVLVYCQHSLGLGHLKRTWVLAEALSSAFRVVLASGGEAPRGLEPPSSIEVLELPALAQDADGILFPVDRTASLATVRRMRERLLLDTYRALHPAAVVIELFPFGRRKFQDELIALLEETRQAPRPVVATSVRDLLVNRGADQRKHDDRARELLDAYFDLVLVHTDPRFATLDETFAPSAAPIAPIYHTGFVAGGSVTARGGARHEILVSGGGGRFAERLYLSAIDAHDRLGPGAPPMTVVAGPLCPDEVFERIRTAAERSPAIRVERTVDDLCRRMRTAALSVSQCGYNTALDIVRSGAPALLVPFTENGDSEQVDRARRLERLNAARVFDGAALDGPTLAAAMRDALAFVPDACPLDLGGAATTARILKHFVARTGATLEARPA